MGIELENMVNEILKDDNKIVDNVDNFLGTTRMAKDEVFVLPKQLLKKSEIIDFIDAEPDFVILKISNHKHHCYIIELKDVHVFDTKKIAGEKQSLLDFRNNIATKIPYTCSIHICVFNQEDKNRIYRGMKKKFNLDEIMTGKEFCNLLEIDYEALIEKRKEWQYDNLARFVMLLLEIPDVKKEILKQLR